MNLVRRIGMKTLIAVILFTAGSSLLANEPGWTNEDRTEHRQAVLSGSVQKIEKVKDQETPNVHLMRATIVIGVIKKGAELVGDTKKVVIYYETSPLGAGYRCPTFPALKKGDSGCFYLRYDSGLTEQESFVLGMGSDFQIKQEAEPAASGQRR